MAACLPPLHSPGISKMWSAFFAVNIVGDTGLPKKDNTMKTNLNSKNTTIRSLTFAFCIQFTIIVAEFERRFKFKPRLKYGWFHLKLYQMFQNLSRRFKPGFGRFKPWLKFFKFHLWLTK